jgi:hypothetical protein
MIYKWFKENRIAMFAIGALLLCLAIGWVLYTLFGHQLINTMYEGKSIGILNRMIHSQAVYSVEEYYKAADGHVLRLYKILSNLLMYFIIVIIGLWICVYIGNQKVSDGFLYIFVFMATFPKIGRAIETGIDPSWQYALNHFFLKNMLFGKDIMFSYGPLGFLEAPQPVGINLLIGTCYSYIIHFLIVYSGICLITSIHKKSKPVEKAVYTTIFSWALINCNNTIAGIITTLFSISPLLVLLLILDYEESKRSIFMFLAAGYIGSLFLIKMGSGITCLVFLGTYLIMRVIKEKKCKLFLWVNSAIIIAFFAIWFLIYLNFNGVTDYMLSNLQFMKGNESAMSIDPGNNLSAVLFITTISMIIYFMFYMKEKNTYLISYIFIPSSLIVFKYAFGRQDKCHFVVFFNFLLIYYFAIIVQRLSLKKKLLFSTVFCLSLAMFFITTKDPGIICNLRIRDGIKNLYNSSFGYKLYRDELENKSQINISKQLLSKEMLKEIGQYPTDIYPWDATYSLANNLNWRPRPVFQSQLAYTPWLDEVNCNFFRSERAPVYIVWITDLGSWGGSHESVDHRYLFSDEPKTMQIILNNYESILYDKNAVLMRRKEKPTFGKSIELNAKKYEWDKWIDVPLPESSCVRAKIEFAPNMYGKIKRLLWKEKEVFIEYKLKNGNIKRHRLVIDNAISGVWIQPYITDIASVLKNAAIMPGIDLDEKDNLFFGKTVKQIRLSHKDKNTFEPYFKIIWEEINLNRRI